jgi:hypothetical protein
LHIEDPSLRIEDRSLRIEDRSMRSQAPFATLRYTAKDRSPHINDHSLRIIDS